MNALTDKIYNDENAARDHLEAIRWPNGPICPHCGSVDNAKRLEGKAARPGLLNCRDCRKQFSVTVGTVFERSKIPLTKWLACSYLMASSKKGISAHQIHRMLGVTYKTAWFMCHRIREAMNEGPDGLLGSGGGTVEADETYWGNVGKKDKKARGYQHKMKVFSLVDRNGKKRSFHVERVTGETLAPMLRQHVSPDANLMTDEHGAYYHIGKEFASHEVVTHSRREYARGTAHTNTVEASFSLLKRGLVGTFHHVGEQHLQRYCTEFDFRWNYRSANGFEDTERADMILKGIQGKRLTYRRPDEARA
jgi:transposase-like protein